MCNPTSSPPRRDLYELTTELAADKGGFLVPESDRRWKYLGPETHYGYSYHIWENALTKGRFAWEVMAYRSAMATPLDPTPQEQASVTTGWAPKPDHADAWQEKWNLTR